MVLSVNIFTYCFPCRIFEGYGLHIISSVVGMHTATQARPPVGRYKGYAFMGNFIICTIL